MTRTARSGLASAVKHAAGLVDRVTPPAPGAVILLYHRVGTAAALQLDVPASAFDEQMAILAATGRGTHLDAAVEVMVAGDAGGARPPLDPAVVTFDDGTADIVEHALPILVRHQVPATVYVATDFVEEQRPFPYDGTPLSWAALAEAVSTGLVTIGSHTHTHAVMDKLDDIQADEELRRSRELIEDRLGVPARHFAYPKGVATARAEAAVRRRYRSAALADMGVNPYGSTDRYRLARSPIQRSDGLRWFTAKLAGGLALEGRLRARMNRRRYSAAWN